MLQLVKYLDGYFSQCSKGTPGILTPGSQPFRVSCVRWDQSAEGPFCRRTKGRSKHWAEPQGLTDPRVADQSGCSPQALALPMCSVVTPLYSLHNESSVAAGKPPARLHPQTVTLARGFAHIRAHERGSHARERVAPFEVSGRAELLLYRGSGTLAAGGGSGCFLKYFDFQAQLGSKAAGAGF